MSEFTVGRYAVSTAGHDAGECYVIIQADSEYVYLVNGKIRTLNHRKKKKLKHIRLLDESDHNLIQRIMSKTVKDEEIKRAIKLYRYSN